MIRTPFLRFISGVAGFILTLLSVRLTAAYGFTINFDMGIALGVVSFMAGYILCIAYEVIENSGSWRKFVMPAAIFVAVTITCADFLTNASTIGYNKEVDITSATENQRKIQLVAQEDGMASKRVSDYEKAVSDIEKANPWLASVTADGLLQQIRNQEGDRVYKRSKECADVTLPESRNFCNSLTRLREQHAFAVKLTSAQEELASARQALSRVRQQAQTQQLFVSAALVQNDKLAGLFTASMKPDAVSVHWVNTYMMVFFGMLITLASQFFNFVAWAGNLPSFGKAGAAAPAPEGTSDEKTDGLVASLKGRLKEMEEVMARGASKVKSVAMKTSPEEGQTKPLGNVQVIERHISDREFAKSTAAAIGDFQSRALARRKATSLAEAA